MLTLRRQTHSADVRGCHRRVRQRHAVDILRFLFDAGIDYYNLRGQEKHYSKEDFKLDVEKFAFSNRMINNWSSVQAQCY